mmetsp:Transcript_13789/g.14898  ORF Transcript_13789/g.14898 Transcript_13789/m.14898 type:complete len:305 (-) Transcript_13789:143-1057(-)
MILRSLRTTVVNELKTSRKRRWMTSISTASSFPFSPTSSSSSCANLPSSTKQYFIPTNNHSLHYPSGINLFSSKSDSTNKVETKKNVANESETDLDAFPPPQTVWEQLQSIPNLITLSRLTSTPLLCYWIVQEDYKLAIFGCLLAGMSDGIDGYIAKNHGGSTVLGTYLDPLADKVLINGLAISLCYSGILPTPLILIWASKDVTLLSGMGFYLLKDQRTINFFHNSVATKPLTVTPSTLGKINTGLQFATLAVGILTPVIPYYLSEPFLLQSLCWVTGTSSIVTVISYMGQGGFTRGSREPKL